MTDWPDDDLAMKLGRSFANVAAAAMESATGMKLTVSEADNGFRIDTSDPEALKREFGDRGTMPESWSVKGLVEAERMFNEQPRGGV